MTFNEKYPQLERTLDTLDFKALGPNSFRLVKQSRKSTKVSYQELKESRGSRKELTENDFEDFIQQSISKPKKDAVIRPLVVTERECDTTVQSSILTPEQMDALIAELQ
ncbi:unnamed protein product [Lactuca saligna]|uniref:Uncharacterized protein n=1 Tax=Lactuca saligna TaxID=75948 RepID=A0AA35ZKM8_LACSI|nr:unnamed protein product [Lactuca saligna]